MSKGGVSVKFSGNRSGNKEVLLWTYLNLNQLHFQTHFAKGRVAVEFGENRSGNKEVVLWTYLNLNQVHFQNQLEKGRVDVECYACGPRPPQG